MAHAVHRADRADAARRGRRRAGVSSGDAMAAVEEILATLPQGIGHEWTGQSRQELLSGSRAPALYALSILFVFLCLTTRRQQAGTESSLAVLDAQRSLYGAQQRLISVQLAAQVNRLTLFKVLGGA